MEVVPIEDHASPRSLMEILSHCTHPAFDFDQEAAMKASSCLTRLHQLLEPCRAFCVRVRLSEGILPPAQVRGKGATCKSPYHFIAHELALARQNAGISGANVSRAERWLAHQKAFCEQLASSCQSDGKYVRAAQNLRPASAPKMQFVVYRQPDGPGLKYGVGLVSTLFRGSVTQTKRTVTKPVGSEIPAAVIKVAHIVRMQDHGNGVFTASCLRALDIVEPMESIVCEMEPKKLQEVGLMLKVCFAPEQTDMLSKLSSGNLVPAQLPRPSDSEFLTANSFGRHKEGYSRIQHWLGQLPKLYQKADVDLLKRLKLPAGTTWQAFCAQAPGYFQSAGKSLSNAEFGEVVVHRLAELAPGEGAKKNAAWLLMVYGTMAKFPTLTQEFFQKIFGKPLPLPTMRCLSAPHS